MNRFWAAVALPLVLLATSCSPSPARHLYGVLIADDDRMGTDYAAGFRQAQRSEYWDTWSPTVTAHERTVLDAYRAGGWQVGINLGLHFPPADVAHLVDSNGVVSPQADLIWNQTARDRAAVYIRDVLTQLGPLNVVTVGLSTTGEIAYPDPVGTGWWREAPHGDPAVWWTWYRDSLVGAARWEIDTIRAAGFTGVIKMQAPGTGARPTVFNAAMAAGLVAAPATVRQAAVFDQTLPAVTAGEANVVVVATSLANQTGIPIGNACAPDDLTRPVSDPTINTWSSVRWVTWVARHAGVPVWAENTGNNVVADLPTVMAQLEDCDIPVLDWAFDYQMYDGTHASVTDLAAMIGADHP